MCRAYNAEVPMVSVDSEDEIFHATATSGHSLQLACDVHAAHRLVWTRLGQSLQDVPQFKASFPSLISVRLTFNHNGTILHRKQSAG